MGNEFIELFEEWADHYDQSVSGHDLAYREVFKHYDKILQEVANLSRGHVLEFGSGTGNLTTKLLGRGLTVTAIEPSPSMRKLAEEKITGRAEIKNGDFLSFELDQAVDSIVSTYAFHHLTDQEKEEAICLYSNYLTSGGKIVFADTMYEHLQAYEEAIQNALENGYNELAEDLRREYYTTIPVLETILKKHGFFVSFKQYNDFVWIMEGIKE